MAHIAACSVELIDVPASCIGVPVVMGIDEAGRGPVLGSMVYACAYWAQDQEARIAALGFDDSKALTEARREQLFTKLKADGNIGYCIVKLTAAFISARMLQRTPYSLNAMSHDTAIDMVKRVVDQGVQVAHVYVDTVGDPSFYESKLRRAFNNSIAFTVSKKADSLYKCVSAASICAKVTRDDDLRRWSFDEPAFTSITARSEPPAAASCEAVSAKSSTGAPAQPGKRGRGANHGDVVIPADDDEGSDALMMSEDEDNATPPPASASSRAPATMLHPSCAGSGYPGDATTKDWLRKTFDPVFGWPRVLRFSWATAKEIFDKEGVKFEWEEEEDADAGEAGAPRKSAKINAFFVSAPRGASGEAVKLPTSAYLRKRRLQRVHAL